MGDLYYSNGVLCVDLILFRWGISWANNIIQYYPGGVLDGAPVLSRWGGSQANMHSDDVTVISRSIMCV